MDSKVTEKNAKLEAAKYLRLSAAESRQRLQQVNHILYGNLEGNTNYTEIEQNKTSDRWWFSIAIRSCLVLLILFCIWLQKIENIPANNSYLQVIKKQITEDYSENIFDFIDQIPYTFSYEKINVTGRDPIKN